MTTTPLSAEPSSPYLTPEEVAGLLKVSAKSVYRWAKDDASMPVLRIGGVLRFHRERLERWLRDREQGTARPRRSVKPLPSRDGRRAPSTQGPDLAMLAPSGEAVNGTGPGPVGHFVGR